MRGLQRVEGFPGAKVTEVSNGVSKSLQGNGLFSSVQTIIGAVSRGPGGSVSGASLFLLKRVQTHLQRGTVDFQ